MNNLGLMLIGAGLSMDAFAVAICKGLVIKEKRRQKALIVALFFGIFQGMMPVAGFFIGSLVSHYVMDYGHWVAFFLLLAISLKMLWESRKTCPVLDEKICIKEMTGLSIATSVDAFAVGVTFVFLDVVIWKASLLIGGITFGVAFLGVRIGNALGERFEMKADLIGGLVLLVMAIKVLLDHYSVF
jgi:putative Mn2+ efflux pump MntP